MKRALIWLFLLLLASPGVAQSPSPGRLGVTKTLDPEGVYVLDKTGTWVTIGSMSGGAFTPVAGGGTFTWPGTADVGQGGAAPTLPLATMPYVNAFLQNNATVFSKRPADPADVVSGPLNAADVATVCVTTPSSQVQCTGTPTANSSVQTAIDVNTGSIGVTATVTGGTISSGAMSMEISQDGVNWYGRGIFLDSNPAPIWKNGLIPPFAGIAPGGKFKFYRARLTSWTVSSGTPVVTVTIAQSQTPNMQYVGNLPTSAAGVSGSAAVAMQGIIGGLPVRVRCPDDTTSCFGGGGGSGSGFTPTGNTLTAPLAPAATSVASIAAPTGGIGVLINNTGTAMGNIRLSVGSGTATANDLPIQPGAGCFLVLGANTWINAYGGPTTGAVFNASAGNGIGNCPTGGGGGVASGGGGSTPQGAATKLISSDTAATQVLITHVTGQYTFIGHLDVVSTGITSVTFEYGTGTNCGTGTVVVGGRYDFPAGGGLSSGAGLGSVGVLPLNVDFCMINSSANHVGGSLTYAQGATAVTAYASLGGGGGGGGGTFTWPGTAAADVGSAATAGTMPYVNAYLPDIQTKTLTTVNPCVTAFVSPTSSGCAMGANGPGALMPLIQASASAKIDISTATTTQLVALAASKTIYVTSWDVISSGTGNITLEYGTQIESFTASFASNIMTITVAVNGSDSIVGQAITATGVTGGTTVSSLQSGTLNAVGSTYLLSTTPGTLGARGVTVPGVTACNVGTTTLTGAYPLGSQAGIAKGVGLGPVLIVPTNNNLCALTSAAVGMKGSLSYAQF